MKRILLWTIYLSALAAFADASCAVKMPRVFGDHMVLQRQTEARLWGRADGRTVTVETSWDGRSYTARTDDAGRWSLRVQTPEAGGPYSITVSDGTPLVLRDVMIGEVWICAGQSNMAMRLKGYMSQPVQGAAEAIVTSGRYRDRIRVLNVPRRASQRPMEDFEGASWVVSEPSRASEFSAVAFFFARCLTESLGIPVGIVDSSWGGSAIEAWMDEEANRRAWPDIPIPAPEETPQAKRPLLLYNGLICPIAGYTARGFLWYQGEGNARKDASCGRYADQLEALVGNWCRIWDDDEMPFFIVQIAPHNNGDANGTWFPRLVEQQVEAALRIPGCGIVPTTDVGEAHCIHPSDKRTVGFRLAVLAMGRIYGGIGGIPLTGPIRKSHRFGAGSAVIEFDNAPLGLIPVSAPILGFEMAGKDRRFHPARAVVNAKRRSSVTVTCDLVPEPVAVRYAFRNYMPANLANSAGFPAFPFRTDDWEEQYDHPSATKTPSER